MDEIVRLNVFDRTGVSTLASVDFDSGKRLFIDIRPGDIAYWQHLMDMANAASNNFNEEIR